MIDTTSLPVIQLELTATGPHDDYAMYSVGTLSDVVEVRWLSDHIWSYGLSPALAMWMPVHVHVLERVILRVVGPVASFDLLVCGAKHSCRGYTVTFLGEQPT